jgi:hypothetical protein
LPVSRIQCGAVEKSLEDGEDAVVADLDAAEVLQPCVGAFDFPVRASALVQTTLRSAISRKIHSISMNALA